MKYSVVVEEDAKSYAVEERTKERLQSSGWIYDKAEPQLVICAGGGGTPLYGVHQYLRRVSKANFLGVHTGALGFFANYTGEELGGCLHDVLEEEPVMFEFGLLKIKLDDNLSPCCVLNEMRAENIVKSQVMDIYVDGGFFETCRGSGVCLSTQAGSATYSRSPGGAAIDCRLSLMQLVEVIAIQHSKHRSLGNPYIIMESCHIAVKSETSDTAILYYDRLNVPLEAAREVYCKMSDREVGFARYCHYSYLRRLKNLY